MARGRANERLAVVNLQKIRHYFGEKKVKVVLALNISLIIPCSLIRAIAGQKYLKEMIEKK